MRRATQPLAVEECLDLVVAERGPEVRRRSSRLRSAELLVVELIAGGRSHVPLASGLTRGLPRWRCHRLSATPSGAAGVTRRRLDPDLIEDALAQDPPVADAVERDAAGEAQIAQAGLALRERAPSSASPLR